MILKGVYPGCHVFVFRYSQKNKRETALVIDVDRKKGRILIFGRLLCHLSLDTFSWVDIKGVYGFELAKKVAITSVGFGFSLGQRIRLVKKPYFILGATWSEDVKVGKISGMIKSLEGDEVVVKTKNYYIVCKKDDLISRRKKPFIFKGIKVALGDIVFVLPAGGSISFDAVVAGCYFFDNELRLKLFSPVLEVAYLTGKMISLLEKQVRIFRLEKKAETVIPESTGGRFKKGEAVKTFFDEKWVEAVVVGVISGELLVRGQDGQMFNWGIDHFEKRDFILPSKNTSFSQVVFANQETPPVKSSYFIEMISGWISGFRLFILELF